MNDFSTILVIAHTFSLIFWIGGLFAYLFIVWPSIFHFSRGKQFPRDILGILANKTAPWIYLAMISALITAIIFLIIDTNEMVNKKFIIGYILVIFILIANNAYGTATGWAKILWAPENTVKVLWRNFYIRMFVSFLIGMVLLFCQLLILLAM